MTPQQSDLASRLFILGVFVVCLTLFLIGGISSCGREERHPPSRLSATAPVPSSYYSPRVDYMKELVVLSEGTDGLSIYIILADDRGQQVRAQGTVEVKVRDEDNDKMLFYQAYEVDESDFVHTTVGLGAFEHKATLLSLGRISYDDLKYIPKGRYPELLVVVVFTEKDGKQVKGHDNHFIR